MQRFKIVAIAQVHNEIRRGNLERFFKHLKPLVDEIIIYDDASTDGSYEYAVRNATRVLRGTQNNFQLERAHRQTLLETALTYSPDAILWLDADEVLTHNASEELQSLCRLMMERNVDGISLHELNLWRNRTWRRTDSAYDDGWFVRLWRAHPDLRFENGKIGLHQQLYPETIKTIERSEKLGVLHYGFSSDEELAYKYLNYRRHGQRGWLLHRFIDETKLTTVRVDQSLFPPDLRADDPQPNPRSLGEWHALLTQYRETLLKPSVSVISMIYKSTKWLQFCYEQVLRYTDFRDKEFLFIANDPTDEVLSYLERHYIPHVVFRTTPEQKQEWYINNVYRGYNFGAQQARGDYLLFINSDMAFTPNWVEQLLSGIDGKNCIASRLVESGKLASGAHAISKNFGQELEQYDEQAFQKYANTIRQSGVIEGGLYMPLLIKRQDLLDVGGYPEGNVTPDSDPFHPTIAKKGEPLISGDTSMIQKITARGIHHQTSNSSIVYHFQEGEKDDPLTTDKTQEIKVVVVNDYLTGRNGERTMWDFLLEGLPGVAGVDKRVIGEGEHFEQRARIYIRKHYPNVRIIIQNATFMDLVDPSLFTIAILQDDLRRMGTPSTQQEKNLARANVLVTNSLLTASSYPEYTFEIISLGVDERLFSPRDAASLRTELGLPSGDIGIFVGSLSATKGWSEVRSMIERRTDIHWIVVSKYDETYGAPNVTMYKQIDQTLLAKLLNAADFFILGSPVETQCLAAIEACLCDIPILMHLTGIFADFSEAERAGLGRFSTSLNDQLDTLLQNRSTFHPRDVILQRGLTVEGMVRRWHQLLLSEIIFIDQRLAIEQTTPFRQRLSARMNHLYQETRLHILNLAKKILKPLLPKALADKLYRIVYH